MSDEKPVSERFLDCVAKSWMWFIVYGVAFVCFIIDFFSNPHASLGDIESVIWPWIVVFFAIGFVHVFTTNIPLPPSPLLPEQQRKDDEYKNDCIKSEQRRRWMIYSYGFMLISLISVVYLLTFGWGEEIAKRIGNPMAPVSVLVGCSLNENARDVSCDENNKNSPQPDAAKKAGKEKAGKEKAGKGGNGGATGANQNTGDQTQTANGMWVLNIGGFIKNIDFATCLCTNRICEINGGIVVPLYAIFIALMGGSVSLTRRLPEYQAQANSEYVATDKLPKLTQHQFREYLVFQIVQFMSAPLLAILAYYLVEPNKILQTVVLSFTAGFASETILLMIRSVADKLSPSTPGSEIKVGSVTGVVKFNDNPAINAEVYIAATPSLKSVTDASGHYVISNVPVGEHALNVKIKPDNATDPVINTESVKINLQNEVVTKNMDIKKPQAAPASPNPAPIKT